MTSRSVCFYFCEFWVRNSHELSALQGEERSPLTRKKSNEDQKPRSFQNPRKELHERESALAPKQCPVKIGGKINKYHASNHFGALRKIIKIIPLP